MRLAQFLVDRGDPVVRRGGERGFGRGGKRPRPGVREPQLRDDVQRRWIGAPVVCRDPYVYIVRIVLVFCVLLSQRP